MNVGNVTMDRRKFSMGVISGVSGAAAVLGAEPPAAPKPPDQMPTIFMAHGSPQSIDDANWMAKLGTWTKEMPKPKSILMISD